MEDVRCEKQAVFAYTWPGRHESYVSYVCEGHAAAIRKVWEVIGCEIEMRIDTGHHTCRSILSREELEGRGLTDG